MAKTLPDTLHGVSVKVTHSKKYSEYKIRLFELMVYRLFALDQNTCKIFVCVKTVGNVKIFCIASKEMSSFYSQMSVCSVKTY